MCPFLSMSSLRLLAGFATRPATKGVIEESSGRHAPPSALTVDSPVPLACLVISSIDTSKASNCPLPDMWLICHFCCDPDTLRMSQQERGVLETHDGDEVHSF